MIELWNYFIHSPITHGLVHAFFMFLGYVTMTLVTSALKGESK